MAMLARWAQRIHRSGKVRIVSSQLAVEVSDLEKRYEKAGVQALAGVSFGVEQGEIFGFLGRNGAGKSTIVRILTTLLRPTAGRALVAGFDVCTHPERCGRSSAEPSRRPPSTS